MSGIDTILKKQKLRKRAQNDKLVARKKKAAKHASGAVPSTSTTADSTDSASGPSSEDDDEFDPHATPSRLRKKRTNKNIVTPEVAASLDRVMLPDRSAMFVVSAVAQALGHDLNDVVVSQSSIQRARQTFREDAAVNKQASFLPDRPLLLHWDGRLLPDITGQKQFVDRVAVLVTGGEIEQLLAVPKIGRGTGDEQCRACLQTLDDWQLRRQVRGLVFDTTAANTGLKMGACTLIEKALDIELVWITCRHHVLEVMLGDVFLAVMGATSGPDIGIFKRFQKSWPYIDKAAFQPAGDELFVDMPEGVRQEMAAFYAAACQKKTSRDDYAELLRLCSVFLSGSSDDETCFRAPGAMHNARWMAKAIYSIKMFVFRDQLKLTAREVTGMTKVCLFVSLVYARYWHEAPIAEKAPLNDLHLIALLDRYPEPAVRVAAISAFRRHLWYLSEHLAPLALFDDRVDDDTKAAMVQNLSLPPHSKALKRLDGKTFDHTRPLGHYITRRSLTIFSLLASNGEEDAKSFLSKPPSLWSADSSYQSLKSKVKLLKVVNDCAERGVALIQHYNTALTKDESQKQYLLRLVSRHRKDVPDPTKAALKRRFQ